jgi:hypothetical protein
MQLTFFGSRVWVSERIVFGNVLYYRISCVEKRGECGSEGACYAKEINIAGNSIRLGRRSPGRRVDPFGRKYLRF